MLRLGITAWIAGGSSFLFLPELPQEGIGFFVGITLALTIAWFSLRKTQVQLSGFCLLLALFIFGWTYSFQYADSRLTKPFPEELENQEIRVSGYIDQLPNGD